MGLPFNRFPIATTNDVDVAQSVLSRNFVDLRSASSRNPNRFRFEMNGINLGRTLLAFTQVSSDIEFDAGVIEEAVVVSLGVSSGTILNLDGKSVDAKDLAIVSPGRRLRVVRSAGSGSWCCGQILMRFKRGTVK